MKLTLKVVITLKWVKVASRLVTEKVVNFFMTRPKCKRVVKFDGRYSTCFKVVVCHWTLNIYTYSSCQKIYVKTYVKCKTM